MFLWTLILPMLTSTIMMLIVTIYKRESTVAIMTFITTSTTPYLTRHYFFNVMLIQTTNRTLCTLIPITQTILYTLYIKYLRWVFNLLVSWSTTKKVQRKRFKGYSFILRFRLRTQRIIVFITSYWMKTLNPIRFSTVIWYQLTQ